MASSNSTSVQYDLTSGQDAAHKLGQEKSALTASQLPGLYSGDIASVMASANRIRDIQKYLARGGYDQEMEVIPRARMSSMAQSHSTSS